VYFQHFPLNQNSQPPGLPDLHHRSQKTKEICHLQTHLSLEKGRHKIQISTLFYPEEEIRNKKAKEKNATFMYTIHTKQDEDS
jgi:hypothetical protein